MRILLAAATALTLGGCSAHTTAANETDNMLVAENVQMADNGAVADPGASAANAVPPAGGAMAQLQTADGRSVGTVTASAAPGGVTFTVDGRMLPAGAHGIHIHAIGQCVGPRFDSAGPHWNPTGRQHGRDNPQGPHEGDLPNLMIDNAGTGTVTFTVRGAQLAQLLDADGAALVVHAKVDDYRTDPSGNSGDRIACGVFRPGA